MTRIESFSGKASIKTEKWRATAAMITHNAKYIMRMYFTRNSCVMKLMYESACIHSQLLEFEAFVCVKNSYTIPFWQFTRQCLHVCKINPRDEFIQKKCVCSVFFVKTKKNQSNWNSFYFLNNIFSSIFINYLFIQTECRFLAELKMYGWERHLVKQMKPFGNWK